MQINKKIPDILIVVVSWVMALALVCMVYLKIKLLFH